MNGTLRCCQLVRKARVVVAQPWFEHGDYYTVVDGKRHFGNVGKLVLLTASRSVGRVQEVLGDTDNIHAVMRGLLGERGALGAPPQRGHEIGEPAQAVLEEIASFDDAVPLADERLDLRSQLCVTVDPPDARDHDDAVGLEEPGEHDGGAAFVVWVHIADVTAYAPVGSALDLHALERALSVYVPGTVAPMLPARLSSDLCSLRPGVDRGCLSVRVALSAEGVPLKTSFSRTLIRSARRLSYDQVDAVLAGEESIDPVVDDLLSRMAGVAAMLRERRMKRGALSLTLTEVSFELGELYPMHAVREPESPSHKLVEECMLLANEAVGNRLSRGSHPAVYRRHDDPDPWSLHDLASILTKLGVPVRTPPDEMDGPTAAAYAAEVAETAFRYSDRTGRGHAAFPSRVLRSLKQAVYDAQPCRHSGLATSNYVHFTSPIRRYPDIVNHRSLLNMLGGTTDEPAAAMPVDSVALHATDREREAVDIERMADKIVLAHLLNDLVIGDPQASFDGEVVGMIGSGVFVRFGDVFEGFLPARMLGPDSADGSRERYYIDEQGIAMVGESSGERIQLGDAIRVHVRRVSRSSGKVDLGRDADAI